MQLPFNVKKDIMEQNQSKEIIRQSMAILLNLRQLSFVCINNLVNCYGAKCGFEKGRA